MPGRVLTLIRVMICSTASLGALLGCFAIERTQNVGLVYTVIGLLLVGIALAFFAAPLGRASYTESQTEPPGAPE